MNTEQREVARWWHSGRDYQAGVMLLAMFGKNKVLVHTLMKKSEKYGRDKLEYELPKAVGLQRSQLKIGNEKLKIEEEQPASSIQHPVTSNQQQETSNLKPVTRNLEPEQETGYPVVIRRIKHEYSELFNQRSIKHKAMGDVPTENSTANMDARAKLLGEIKLITTRIEELYHCLEAWEKTGALPDANILWPKPQEPEQLPDDADKLRLMKKNLQTSNTKDRNLLVYQQQKKADTPAPMPDGPKRKMIEQRIKAREELIEKVDEKLAEQLKIRN